jgi:hypothetical protein
VSRGTLLPRARLIVNSRPDISYLLELPTSGEGVKGSRIQGFKSSDKTQGSGGQEAQEQAMCLDFKPTDSSGSSLPLEPWAPRTLEPSGRYRASPGAVYYPFSTNLFRGEQLVQSRITDIEELDDWLLGQAFNG